MGGEHREKTDQVLADGADEDALRAILAAAAEPDRFERLSDNVQCMCLAREACAPPWAPQTSGIIFPARPRLYLFIIYSWG